MPRTVSSPTQSAAAAHVSQPMFLVQIEWDGQTSRLCTHSTQSWNGYTWAGEGVVVDAFDEDGRPSRIVLSDPAAAYRTLVLASGIRDRRVSIWKAHVGSLAAGDPVDLFVGYGESAEIVAGKVYVPLGRSQSSAVFTPRERIGPSIGVNFVAPPGTRIAWGSTTFVIEARS